MIVVTGLPRTGTSVMVEILKKNGYYAGREIELVGHKYRTELSFLKDLHTSTLIAFGNILTFFKWENLFPFQKQAFESVNNFIKENQINVVKDNYLSPFFLVWKTINNELQDAHFIWTRRDIEESTKSMLRLQESFGIQPSDFEFYNNAAKNLDSLQQDMMEYYVKDYTEIWLDDLLEDPEKYGSELSGKLGKTIDMSLINRDETWEKTQIPQ